MKSRMEKRKRSIRGRIFVSVFSFVVLLLIVGAVYVVWAGQASGGGVFVYDLYGGGAARSNEISAKSLSNTGGGNDVALMNAQAYPAATQAAGVIAYAPAQQLGAVSSEQEPNSNTAAYPVAESTQETPKDMFFEDYGVNPFMETSQDHLSTFAMDVDTASYTLTRSYLLDYKQVPPPDAVRPEEFINYYPMNYAPPTDGSAFAIHMDAAPSPFSEEGQILLRVGVQGRIVEAQDREPALLIFVIDVSGSMGQTNRLELAKQALEILVNELREDDRVAIVVYSDATRIVLEPTPASEKQTILSAIYGLHTEGSTNAEAGLRLGYDLALAHLNQGGTTRVILASDGVANVGNTGPNAILNTIHQGVDAGITLSTIGFGMGNYNDVLMEQLANDGNGNYYYVDNLREARRIFSYNLTSTLQVIGYDAKIQVDFNPDVVTRYRLIGYENRDIADADFRNDTVDAGEVGAGHTITALYEVELAPNTQSGTLATARLRFEDAETRQVIEMSQAFDAVEILPKFELASEEFRLTAALAEFSEVLRHSPFGDSRLEDILAVVDSLSNNNSAAEELQALVRAAMPIWEQ